MCPQQHRSPLLFQPGTTEPPVPGLGQLHSWLRGDTNAIKGNEYARKKKSERKKLCLLALTPHLSPAIATHHPLLAQDFVSGSGISPPSSSNRPTTERWFQEFMDNNQAVITCLCKVTLSHLGNHLRTRLIPGIPCPYFSNPAWEKQLLVLFSY